MKKTLKYIISIGLSGFLVKLLDFIPWNDILRGESWQWLFAMRFSIFHCFLFLIVFFIVLWFLSLFNYKEYKLNKKRKKLEKINQLLMYKGNITVKWDVYFGSTFDNDPHPTNIKIFCNKHKELGFPVLIKDEVCPACNDDYIYKKQVFEDYVESYLLAKWNEILKDKHIFHKTSQTK